MRAAFIFFLLVLGAQTLYSANAKLKPRESFYQYHTDTHIVLVNDGRSEGQNNFNRDPPIINYPLIELSNPELANGNYIRLTVSGDVSYSQNSPELPYNATAVFTINGNLDQRDTQPNRFNLRENATVTVRSLSALEHGDVTNYLDVNSAREYVTSNPPDDFLVGSSTDPQGIIVKVPQGANCLFGALLDTTYTDNGDPDGDARIFANAVTDSERPRYRFERSTFSGNEGSTASVQIRRYQNASIKSVVYFRTIPDTSSTAASSADYAGISSEPVTFLPGETVKTIPIPISPDSIYELQESFKVQIWINYDHNPNEAYINTPNPAHNAANLSDNSTALVFINNTTPKPRVNFTSLFDQVSEGDGSIQVRISLEGSQLGFSTSFWLGRIDDTASPEDFIWPAGPQIVVPAFTSQVVVPIPIVDDELEEGTEETTFHLGTNAYLDVEASATSGGSGEGHLRVTIVDNETISDATQYFSTDIPQSNGFLFVQIEPSDIGGAWRFQGEQLWRPSGIPVTGLVPGNRTIEFRPVPGYNHPPSRIVEVLSDGQATPVVSAQYYSTPEAGEGSLTVFLEPSTVSDLILPESDRAQWRFLEPLGAPPSPNNPWRDSSASVDDLVPGTYLIESKTIPGRTTPPPAAIEVGNSGTALTLTYFLPVASSGLAPAPAVVPFEITSTAEGLPYHYVGQVRTPLGSATGFAIKERIVLTAAHAVFDEANLVPMSPVEWLPQRDRGSFEPLPIVPRGMIIQSGYAAQRSTETPGTFSSESRSLDVAALYFDVDAARGSFSGWLASLDATNEWLTSEADKMLVGYPISGIPQANVGRMHATSPSNLTFSSYDANFDQLYRTTDIRSFPGNSGGPLCIAHNGTYFPAGIYLGGQNEAIVRSFDESLWNLIKQAEEQVSTNGNVGAGFTLSYVFTYATPGSTGGIRVNIEPPEAVQNGAGWWITPIETYYPSGNTVGGLTIGMTYQIKFLEATGFVAPPPQSVTVTSADGLVYTATYGAPISELESWRQAHFGATENTGIGADDFDADHDGQDNHSEFIAGTNPRDSSDRFEVQSLIRSGKL